MTTIRAFYTNFRRRNFDSHLQALGSDAREARIVADDLIVESAIEFDEEPDDAEDMVVQFKEFLDTVTPDDFATGS